ncbi:MAG: prepilin-type N-terminal cleavage/methylation domain-containing protein [Clostridiales bacterium]|nr:prepilin-type N-terminal cleavage/methylation domain-containing protein [Clostridiales bacterium]
MRRNHSIKAGLKLDDKGFSLVELIISIAILVIIMVPLMSNFIRSMQMNKKAEKYQLQSNLAASLMEGLKASTTKEIINEFNGPKDSFEIIPNDIDDIMRLELIAPGEYKKRETGIYDEQATDYYAIHGVIAGGSAYDVFIRLDAATESYKTEADDLNNYPMPEIINLDEEANGLLFSDGSSVYKSNETDPDGKTLEALVQLGEEYAYSTLYSSQAYLDYLTAYNQWLVACNEAAMKGISPPPEPTPPTLASLGLDIYTDADYIKKYVTKNMIITVNDTSVSYEIKYNCYLWAPIDITHQIDQVKYASTVENIYLFYKQSIFQSALNPGDNTYADIIYIHNKEAENKVNFFIADQNNTLFNPIKIERPTDDSVKVFTNVLSYEANTGMLPINPTLVNTYELNRIFDITIDICKAETEQSNRYKEVYYTLNSTKER